MPRTLLVTGAGGFLARHLAARFRDASWRTIGIGRSDPDRVAPAYDAFQLDDLSDSARIASLLEKFEPDVVAHLAAPSSVPESLRRPLADFESHALPVARLLDGIRTSALPARMLLLSSAAVYGNPQSLPVAETAPAAPISPYGYHKLCQEILCDEYLRVYAIPVVKARVFSVFGEGLRRLAVWDLARRAFKGQTTVLGTGEEMRDYLYAGDVADALYTIVERASFDGSAINVASGTGTTIANLAQRIFGIAGLDDPPRFTGENPAGMPTAWVADVGRLRALGWEPRHSLDDSLRKTIEWIREHA
jgi:UDP-glucose 4-epimerase